MNRLHCDFLTLLYFCFSIFFSFLNVKWNLKEEEECNKKVKSSCGCANNQFDDFLSGMMWKCNRRERSCTEFSDLVFWCWMFLCKNSMTVCAEWLWQHHSLHDVTDFARQFTNIRFENIFFFCYKRDKINNLQKLKTNSENWKIRPKNRENEWEREKSERDLWSWKKDLLFELENVVNSYMPKFFL